MLQNPDRVEAFTEEIAQMRLPDTASSKDRVLQRVGVGLMVAGPILGVIAYLIGHGTANPLQQRDAIVLTVIGLILAVIGSALYLRAALAQFLRFWMARLAWEQAAATDRVVEAVRDRT